MSSGFGRSPFPYFVPKEWPAPLSVMARLPNPDVVMKLSHDALREAARRGLLSELQADELWTFLQERTQDTPSFRFTHVLYYLGGLIAIGAMTLFMTLGWERFGGWGLFGIALAYAGAGLWLTEHLLNRRQPPLPIPGGIAAVFVVALTPLATYALQVALGWWTEGRVLNEYHRYIDWRWLFMELATLATGALMLWRYRRPFLVMPIAVTLWYMSMDLASLLLGDAHPSWDQRAQVSLWFGLLIAVLAIRVDLRSRPAADYAFWLHLFGALAFWGGLSSLSSDSEWSRFLYLCINLVMIALGVALSRRVFTVLGALGTAGYLGHLAYDVFRESLVFPFALTVIGLGVIYLGILWQRHEASLTRKLRHVLPAPLRVLLDRG